VIGGYIPNRHVLDSILVGYYLGRDLMYAANVRAGSLQNSVESCYRTSSSSGSHDAHSQISLTRRKRIGRGYDRRKNDRVSLASPIHRCAVPGMMKWTQSSLSKRPLLWARMVNEPSQRRAREGPGVDVKILGIDLAKNLFRVHG